MPPKVSDAQGQLQDMDTRFTQRICQSCNDLWLRLAHTSQPTHQLDTALLLY